VTDREVTLGEIYDKMPAEDRKKAFFLLLGIAEFYASEETWFAVGLFPDPPSGDIVRDFRLAPDGQHRPGGRARLARSWIVSMFRRTLGTMKSWIRTADVCLSSIPAVGGIPTIIPTTVISNVPVRKRRKPALPEELPKPPEKT
jgi:hypothetical protein